MQRSSRVDYDEIAELYTARRTARNRPTPNSSRFGRTRTDREADAARHRVRHRNQQIANRGLAPDAKFVGLDGSLGMLRQSAAQRLTSPRSTATARPCRLPPQASEDWLYYTYFPKAKTRDFADFWPPDVIVSEMTAAGVTGIEVERRHGYRERDFAELWSAA